MKQKGIECGSFRKVSGQGRTGNERGTPTRLIQVETRNTASSGLSACSVLRALSTNIAKRFTLNFTQEETVHS